MWLLKRLRSGSGSLWVNGWPPVVAHVVGREVLCKNGVVAVVGDAHVQFGVGRVQQAAAVAGTVHPASGCFRHLLFHARVGGVVISGLDAVA